MIKDDSSELHLGELKARDNKAKCPQHHKEVQYLKGFNLGFIGEKIIITEYSMKLPYELELIQGTLN